MKLGFEAEIMLGDEDDRFGLSKYRGEPPETTPRRVRRIIADELEKYVRSRIAAPPDQTSNVQRKWAILPEYDVEFARYNGPVAAVEIISPPLPLSEAKEALLRVFEYFEDHEAFADDNCGLHLNMSCEDLYKVDPMALAFLIDETLILKKFGRLGHRLLSTHYDHLIVCAASRKLLDPEFSSWSNLSPLIHEGKNFAINFAKMRLSHPYIEFRHAGGNEYFWKPELVMETIDLFAEALELSKTAFPFNPEHWHPQMRRRCDEFSADVEAVTNIFRKENPKLKLSAVNPHFRTPLGFDIVVNGSIVATALMRHDIFPGVALEVPLRTQRAYSDIITSAFGTLELAPLRYCLLKHKLAKATSSKKKQRTRKRAK